MNDPEIFFFKAYLLVCIFAYIAVLFLTLRDLRIFWRTGYQSYKKGAARGLIASTITLAGVLFLAYTGSVLLGLLFVFLGVLVNKKGEREEVFTSAGAKDRFFGKTDIIRPELKK